MVPIFVTPFEKIEGDGLEDKLPELRKILATDYPHPVSKFTKTDKVNLKQFLSNKILTQGKDEILEEER